MITQQPGVVNVTKPVPMPKAPVQALYPQQQSPAQLLSDLENKVILNDTFQKMRDIMDS